MKILRPELQLILSHVAKGGYYDETISKGLINIPRRRYYKLLEEIAADHYVIKVPGGRSGYHYIITELGRQYLNERV